MRGRDKRANFNFQEDRQELIKHDRKYQALKSTLLFLHAFHPLTQIYMSWLKFDGRNENSTVIYVHGKASTPPNLPFALRTESFSRTWIFIEDYLSSF